MTSSLCVTWTEWRHILGYTDGFHIDFYTIVFEELAYRVHMDRQTRGQSGDVIHDVTAAGSVPGCCCCCCCCWCWWCWWWCLMARAFLSSSLSSLMARISFFSFMRRFWNQIFTCRWFTQIHQIKSVSDAGGVQGVRTSASLIRVLF